MSTQVLDYSYKAFTKLDITAAKKIEPVEEVIRIRTGEHGPAAV